MRLTPHQVDKLLTERLDSGLSARSVQHILGCLRSALSQAGKRGIVPRNLASLVTPPRAAPHEIQPFTPDEAKAFLAAARGDRLEALYAVALALGLRRGEALGLTWNCLDLEGGQLTVRQALQRQKGGLTLVEPKTPRSRRTIAIPAFGVAQLKAHRARQVAEQLEAGPDWQDRGFVFTTTIGTPLDPDNVTKYFQKLVKDAGLRRQRFHDLRHACATLLLAQGVSMRTTMEVLGHSQIAVTANLYSHVVPELKRDAADRMDALLAVTEGGTA